jgi:hypothetical protein
MRQKQRFEPRGKKAVLRTCASRCCLKNPGRVIDGRFPSLNGWFASCSHVDFGDEFHESGKLENGSAIG